MSFNSLLNHVALRAETAQSSNTTASPVQKAAITELMTSHEFPQPLASYKAAGATETSEGSGLLWLVDNFCFMD